MPLVALRNGERLEAHRFPAPQWQDLKASYKTDGLTLVCGNPGFPKTSKNGVQFFSHFTGGCAIHDSGPESAEHLALKAVLADAARAHGWEATIEYPAPDRSWIADVLAEKDGQRIALEVQWSPQSPEDFRRRQERYAAVGIYCIWFVHERNEANGAGLPGYVLRGDLIGGFSARAGMAVGVPPADTTLPELVALVLDGALSDRIEVRVNALLITTTMMKCWSQTCNSWMTFWYLSGAELETRCGQHAVLSCNEQYIPRMTRRVEEHVQEQVGAAFTGKDIPAPVRYQTRSSKTHGGPYMAVICPSCNTLQGDAFIAFTARRYTDYRLPGRATIPIDEQVKEHNEHLCRDIGRGRCSQVPGERSMLFPNPLSPGWWLSDGTAEYDIEPLPVKRPRKTHSAPAPTERRMPRFQ